jgi:hypothetical protein
LIGEFSSSAAPAGVDQLEQAAALQIGADVAVTTREAVGSPEIGDRHRNPVGAGTGDFDGKLGLSQLLRSTAKKARKTRREILHVFIFNKFRAILLFKRFVFDFQRALEKSGIIRFGQGRGFKDGAFDRGIQPRIAAGALQLDRQYFARRQLIDFENGFRIALKYWVARRYCRAPCRVSWQRNPSSPACCEARCSDSAAAALAICWALAFGRGFSSEVSRLSIPC